MSVRFSVRLVPRGGRDAVERVAAGGELECRVRAAPVDGDANRALLRLIADHLGVPISAVTLEGGAAARHKRLRVDGIDAALVAARWPGLSVR